ncbi:hypothetical protein MTQ01_15700 [Streptomyces sp. XM4193]|uniref:hypothetical protein n=1 Tax=Streptomyces sp. XM4193 TaxID=2929782 RepID=UPI001FF8192F|nr:hypothetical protein [Streptomyces sp. XM4193]MCK1797441.1 hypothetical protein [Streptomyces sp. XM4193]
MNDSERMPLGAWDQQPLGSMEHRIRSMDAKQLRTLQDHERTHAARPAVLRLLEERQSQLAHGAKPSPGGEGPPSDSPERRRAGSPVTPSTQAPPRHAPPHGTPDQPGRGDRMGPGA